MTTQCDISSPILWLYNAALNRMKVTNKCTNESSSWSLLQEGNKELKAKSNQWSRGIYPTTLKLHAGKAFASTIQRASSPAAINAKLPFNVFRNIQTFTKWVTVRNSTPGRDAWQRLSATNTRPLSNTGDVVRAALWSCSSCITCSKKSPPLVHWD